MQKIITSIVTNPAKSKMKSCDKVHLSDLESNLWGMHIKLDLDFLDKLLKSSSKNKNYFIDKGFVSKIGCGYNKNRKRCLTFYTWFNKGKAMSFLTLSKIIKLSNYSFDGMEKYVVAVAFGRTGKKVFIKFPIEINKGLGNIVGHILGDGSIGRRDKAVFYSNSNIELLKEFRNHMKSIFGIEPRIWVQEKPNFGKTKWMKRIPELRDIPNGHNVGLFYPKVCGVILQAIFGKFANGKHKCITEQIKNSNKQFKIGLLRSFFDDEGSVSCDSYTIRYHQDKKDILEDIRILLKYFDIAPNEIRSYLKKNKERYYLNITGFKEYHRLYNLIGCTSSRKAEQFELLINKVKNGKHLRYKYRDYLCRVTPTLLQ